MSFIVLGDFHQLQPVLDGWIFECEKSPLGILQGPYLWSKFQLYELTQIMRQKDDKRFAQALKNLASGKTTKDDDELFISRQCDRLSANECIPEDSMILFSTNALVNDYNTNFLNSLETEGCISKCIDNCIGEGTVESKRKMLQYAKTIPANKTQGLSVTLQLKMEARYMLTLNIRTEDGLTNGACGRLKFITYGFYLDNTNNRVRIPTRVYLLFEDSRVGCFTRSETLQQMKMCNIPLNLTPIELTTRTMNLTKTSAVQLCRKQFPLTPAEAITIHKSQGGTYTNVVVNLTRRVDRRMLYVACSRATNAKGLFIKGQYPLFRNENKLDKVETEMLRLRTENPLTLTLKFPEDYKKENNVLFIYQNVRSLKKHLPVIKSNISFRYCDILSFVETWTLSQDNLDIDDYTIVQRIDCPTSIRKPFGNAVYA